jgi:hypothetical protein
LKVLIRDALPVLRLCDGSQEEDCCSFEKCFLCSWSETISSILPRIHGISLNIRQALSDVFRIDRAL